MSTVRRVLFLISALALGSPALAHEYWLSPSRYRAAAGDTLAIAAFVSADFRGEPKAYAARWIAADSGGELVGHQSDFAAIELPAAEFDAYLEEEGLDGPRAARAGRGANAGPGRERYARCAKTWIAGGEPDRARRVLGLPIEIVPLAEPGAADTLAVRVLFRGRPLAGARVGVWRQALGAHAAPLPPAARDSVGVAAKARTGADGVARLPVAGEGEWMIATVHMVPSADRNAADWESWWASFTFARTGASAAR